MKTSFLLLAVALTLASPIASADFHLSDAQLLEHQVPAPPVAPAAPSALGGLLQTIFTPVNVGGAVAAVLGVIGGFSFLTNRRKLAIATAVFYAFHATEDAHDQLDDGPLKDGFDKAANALKVADAYLRKTGWRGLKPGDETEAAAIQLQAIHGGEVAKEKLVVAQAEATVAAQAAVPKPA